MASIRKELLVDAEPTLVWDAVRDFGAVHRRLCPGILTDARPEDGARVVTFANGMVVRELLVDLDEGSRRLAYAAVGGGMTRHHNSSIQVFSEPGGRSRLVWITDVLPDEVAKPVGALMEQGAAVMKATLERAARAIGPAEGPAAS